MLESQCVERTTRRSHALFMSLTELCLEQSKVTDMKFADNASIDDNTHGGGEIPPCTRLTPDALPEVQEPVLAENLQSGVSIRNAPLPKDIQEARREARKARAPHWYALRVTYGREKKAYEYLVGKNVEAYYPTIKTVKEVDGKRKTVEESRLPNIFFAHGTEEEIKSSVYDNYNLPFLRFYYKHTHIGSRVDKSPMIVPDSQIKALQIICDADASDNVLVLQEEVKKFKEGQRVQVIEGEFKGVEGIVARFHGQQRVGIVIDGLLTAATAYIPTAFLQEIDENS